MAADSLAAALAPSFDKLLSDWNDVNATRIQLVVNIAQAKANAYQLDAKLDAIVDKLVLALKKLTEDRSDPLWDTYLQSLTAWELKKPVLADQLKQMALWPPSLLASPHQELKDLEAELTPLLAIAVPAEAAVDTAEQALRDFHNVGGWAQHIEQSNVTRTSAFGVLLAIPGQNTALKLPSDYQDLFFLHDTSRRATKPKSSDDIKKEQEAHALAGKKLDADLAEALAREKQEADDQAAREQLQKDRDAQDQAEKDAKAKKKALDKELAKKTKKK
jgi:hypothetical protein